MKQWKTRCLAGLMAAAAAVLMTATAFAADSHKATAARSGVVRVLVTYTLSLYDPDSGSYVGEVSGYSNGSGFGVGTAGEETDVFVTNRHVVVLDDGPITLSGETYYGEYTFTGYYILLDNYAYHTETFSLDTSRVIPCTVMYVGDTADADVAVLRAAEPVPGRVALALQDDEATLEVGDTVSALGYPSSSDSATSEGYLLASIEDVTLTSGVVSRFFDSMSVTAESSGLTGRLIQSAASINSGNSGGPLVDENGVVVGINTYTYHGGSDRVTNAYYALRIQYAKTALDSLGIAYDVAAGGNQILVILIAVAAAAVVAAVVILLVVKGKKKKGQKDGGVDSRGKEKKGSDANDSGFRIQGVAGALEGRRYLIGRTGSVILGRDPAQCGVVFPSDTPGVSSRHCAVWFENGGVYLKDLGSTHGTFLAPGRRLAGEQTVRLMPGDVFFLGSQSQSFVIAERR